MVVFTLILIFLGWFLWSVFQASKIAVAQLKQLHQVPCDRCVYFTHSQHLRCTVRPCQALTELAISCTDFTPIAPATRRSELGQRRYPTPVKALLEYFKVRTSAI
jgi:hypothetical protein